MSTCFNQLIINKLIAIASEIHKKKAEKIDKCAPALGYAFH